MIFKLTMFRSNGDTFYVCASDRQCAIAFMNRNCGPVYNAVQVPSAPSGRSLLVA